MAVKKKKVVKKSASKAKTPAKKPAKKVAKKAVKKVEKKPAKKVAKKAVKKVEKKPAKKVIKEAAKKVVAKVEKKVVAKAEKKVAKKVVKKVAVATNEIEIIKPIEKNEFINLKMAKQHHDNPREHAHEDNKTIEEVPHPPLEPIIREEPKVGRNEPCPCGSGKKYKKCCGQ